MRAPARILSEEQKREMKLLFGLSRSKKEHDRVIERYEKY